MPEITVWPVSSSVRTWKVGSSSPSRDRATESFSWSTFVFGSIERCTTGSGKIIASSTTGESGADSVSTASSAEIWNASYSVPLREEADSSSEKLLQIPRGAELEKLDEDGSWIQVRYAEDGETHTGWVNTDYVIAA